jgi:ATP-dependent DNA ligase
MKETTQSELRSAIDFMKGQNGTGSKARKQEKFRDIYTKSVGHIVTGERYDDAGIGPSTAKSAVEDVFPKLDVDSYPTISEALASDNIVTDDAHTAENSLSELVDDLDEIAELSGQNQTDAVADTLQKHREPSLVTLALLDDESIGLGTSQMRDTFFDGTRDERKHREAFVEYTTEFIDLAQKDALPTRPIVGQPFDPMLAKSDSHLPDDLSDLWFQPKLDGYRIIIHVKQEEIGPKAYAFTRRLNDVTKSLPELQEIDWPERGEYILDGEVIAEDGTYKSTSSRVGRKAENVDRDIDMEFAFFDIILKDGEYVANQPYEEREMILHQAAGDTAGVAGSTHFGGETHAYIVPSYEGLSRVEARAIGSSYEGVIWKDPEAEYQFGKRSTAWVKDKNTAETVDVVATDFEEATGEKSGTLGAIVLESADGTPVGKTGSGFSDAERDKIWQNQDRYHDSVLEVEAEAFDDGLRFPIFQRWRSDDGEADSRERIEEIMKDV